MSDEITEFVDLADEDNDGEAGAADDDVAKMMMPSAILTRILKDEGVSASKEARDYLNRTIAVFLLNLSDASVEAAREHGHKTLCAEDVMKAINEMELPEIVERCKPLADEWKIIRQQKMLRAQARKMARTSAPTPASSQPQNVPEGDDDDDDDVMEMVESNDLNQPGPSSRP